MAAKEQDIRENLGDEEFKRKFISGLNKLGFPLEFRIRKKMEEKGFAHVQEGFFTVKHNGAETTKTYDLHGFKAKSATMHDNLTIHLDLQIVGDCKFSSDRARFILAVPDTSNPHNKQFVGPFLTALQFAVYGRYRNSEIVSKFLQQYGYVYIASDVKDSSKDHILSGEETDNYSDGKVPPHERIYNIVEETVLPALKEKFLAWLRHSYGDYSRQIGDSRRTEDARYFLESQRGGFFSAKLLVPVIVTSKPIFSPIVDGKGNMTDIKEEPFILYEHSVKITENYLELLAQCYDVGVFICNENHFDDFIAYAEHMFEVIFDEIVENLGKHPFRLIDDFNDMQKLDDEIQQIAGRSVLLAYRQKEKPASDTGK